MAKLKLMPSQGGIGAKKVTVNAITLTAEGYKGKVDWSSLERWDLFKSGFPKWLALHDAGEPAECAAGGGPAGLVHKAVSVLCP